jgi:hypothetical protein
VGRARRQPGEGELERLSRDLGVPQHEVAEGFARILPEVVDGLSPGGELPAQADAVLEEGREELEAHVAHLDSPAVIPAQAGIQGRASRVERGSSGFPPSRE